MELTVEKSTSTQYEAFLIITLKNGEEFVENIVEKFKKILEESSCGESGVSKIEKWGKRKFAYPINKESEGFYVLYEFCTQDTALPARFQETARITDGVLRTLVVKK